MVLDDRKIWKLIHNKKNYFKLGRDITIDKPCLYQKIRDNEF